MMPTGWLLMITTSTKLTGYIDFPAFGLSEDDLRSLPAIVDSWVEALRALAETQRSDSGMRDLLKLSEALPVRVGELSWQKAWLRQWHDLSGRGYSHTELFQVFLDGVMRCERALCDEQARIGRLTLKLLACLRSAVVATIACALELDEEARSDETGQPGELSALHFLRLLQQAGRQAAVLSLSVVNKDSFAYLSAGELQRLPSMLTHRMASLLRREDRVFTGREGEWLIILPDVHSMSQPGLAAAQLQHALSTPIELFSGRRMLVRSTVGAALIPEHATDAEAAVHAARLARWQANAAGEGFGWFETGLNADWQHQYELAEELLLALEHEKLSLYLQPQVQLDGGYCFGAELLLRWQRSNGEHVPPPLIIQLIEENGWRESFLDWLLRASMRMQVDLRDAGVDICLSINLTAADVLDDQLPELFSQCLQTWQLPGSCFTLELTESALMADRERGLAVMYGLRDLGCRLALDDFGTGYSSLSYLVSLPINEIKLDRSFVVAMFDSIDSLRVVRTIIDLSRDLDMLPLAEGVEDEAQREQLLALGCAAAQGYFYGKPMSLGTFVEWYREYQQSRAA